MNTIENLYKKIKAGVERAPLNSERFPLHEFVVEKSELIMHMIESMIDKQHYETIIKKLY